MSVVRRQGVFGCRHFDVLVNAGVFLAGGSFSVCGYGPLFFDLLLVLFMPPFFVRVLCVGGRMWGFSSLVILSRTLRSSNAAGVNLFYRFLGMLV